MTPSEQNVAIAEVCGYVYHMGSPGEFGYWTYNNKPAWLPDYHSDLNACARFEDFIYKNHELLVVYESWLCDNVEHPIIATASKRCEAGLRALKLWKEKE